MIQIIQAIRRTAHVTSAVNITLEFPDENFDIKAAVRAACTDFCKTETGREIYEDNCHEFNWVDFSQNVPDEICESHGFRRTSCAQSPGEKIAPIMEVSMDEDLVDETDIFPEEDD